MKKTKTSAFRRLCLPLGIGLLVAAAAVMIAWQWNIRTSAQRMEAYVHTLRTVMPEPQAAVAEVRKDNTMPVFSAENTDFVGILELPRYGSVLPVCEDWGRVSRYPCRFSGSVYDGTMCIGATTQKGQYGFYREIFVGDDLYFTDMTGARYAYQVTDIRYEKHADQAALERRDADLTLFLKNMYAFEYIVIFCDAQG